MLENRKLGLASALGVVVIWSGFIVFSRMGVDTALTAYDITALRFFVAGLVTLPFVWRWWPRHLPFGAVYLLALCGPGALYSVIMYLGLENATAAYGGVFANGSLPIFTIILVAVFAGERPTAREFAGVLTIIAGASLLGVSGMNGEARNVATGIVLFLAASAILSFYLFGVRFWNITPRQALVLVNVPNALVYLPIWHVALPSGLAQAETSAILFQALYQGLGPGLLAVILFALATVHIGPTATAGFSAAVPASAALLAMPVLHEIPTRLSWVGILLVTVGILVIVRTPRAAK
ncbi:MAG: DMT family transporter [Pseudomonadota bacterium]